MVSKKEELKLVTRALGNTETEYKEFYKLKNEYKDDNANIFLYGFVHAGVYVHGKIFEFNSSGVHIGEDKFDNRWSVKQKGSTSISYGDCCTAALNCN